MITIDPKEVPVSKIHALFQGVVIPRPIAFASTINRAGETNLSPFSFFNIFSSQPPILVFSPSRRVRNNTTKHTYENLVEIPEVTINIVSYSMVEQASLASVEFPKGVNEFVKTGLTIVPSERVGPPRIGESPASFECKVNEMIPLGDQGGAGTLVICEVLLAHFKEDLFDAQGRVDPQKVDAVARLGNDYYCRVHGENIFVVPKPADKPAVGVDAVPKSFQESGILTGNDLGRLGNIEAMPSIAEILETLSGAEFQMALRKGNDEVHRLVQKKIREGKTMAAWKVMLAHHANI